MLNVHTSILEEILHRLGYQQIGPSHWIKPWGFNVATYHVDTQRWAAWFYNYSNPEELLLWSEKVVEFKDPDQFMYEIRESEAYSSIGDKGSSRKGFQVDENH